MDKKISYEDWCDKYKPIKNNITMDAAFDGKMFETYGLELDFIKAAKAERIWTLVDSEGNNPTIIPGHWLVNRIGYFITEEPWRDEDLDLEVIIDD